jgi:hypothetical protein
MKILSVENLQDIAREVAITPSTLTIHAQMMQSDLSYSAAARSDLGKRLNDSLPILDYNSL